MKTFAAYFLVGCTLLISSLPAQAVQKCTGPDGKVVFQDLPCAGRGEQLNIRPAMGAAPAPVTTTAPDGGAPQQPMTEAQRLNQQADKMRAARRKQEMELVIVPDAANALNSHRTSCDAELRALQDKKSRASNNLAGATWEQSISTEMTAVSSRCDSRSRELQANLDAVRKECQSVGGCK
jgi:hypothetical protein